MPWQTLSAVAITYFLVWAYGKPHPDQRTPPRPATAQARCEYELITNPDTGVTVQVPRDLMLHLAAMCQGRAKAQSLLWLSVAKYPGRSGRWYVEKTILDLERDRR